MSVCVFACVRVCVRACVRACVHVCVCACVRACVSLASDSSETVEVVIVKLGTVGASDMSASRVNYIDLDLHSR